MLGKQSMTGIYMAGAYMADEEFLLIEEMQHRVANEYAIAIANLALRARACPDASRTILAETAARLSDFAALHRALAPPRIATTVDLGEYLRTLCLAITRANLAELGMSLLFYETEVALEAHRAWRVGLIVSELITNAVRHGSWKRGEGVITVEILSEVGHVKCRVSDNGGGSEDAPRGRGTAIIEALARDLGGHIRREFNKDGVTVHLTVPCGPMTDVSI